jgi:hypothetical protein
MFVLFSAKGNETPGIVAKGYWETNNIFQAYT